METVILTLRDYLTSSGQYPKFETIADKSVVVAAKRTIACASLLLSRIGWTGRIFITSGFRTHEHNKAIGGSVNSHHCYGRAIDISDPDMRIGRGATKSLLEECGLYMEALSGPKGTHSPVDPAGRWVHLQTAPPGSGNRVFFP